MTNLTGESKNGYTANRNGSLHLEDPGVIYARVQDYYGRVLSSTSDLKTTACCVADSPPKYIRDRLVKVPEEILQKFYGCGTPLPSGIEGLNVLDLGCGSGRDCYVAAALAGPSGTVTGVDMTEEQLQVANAHVSEYTKILGYPKPNLRFVSGYIEFLEKAGIERESMDLVISNCVINLSPDKPRVLSEVYASLKWGGELYFSDVYCSRRLPEHVRKHDVLLGECLAGALYIEDFKRLCHHAGFTDPRMMSCCPIEVTDEGLADILGEAKFYSITFRCFKLPELETLCEDYGQIAIYEGGIEGNANAYRLDDHHLFERNLPVRVCGNSASMLGESWLRKYFQIVGSRDVHYGLFDCTPSASAVESSPPGDCC
uniref:Arsenite methyltransferase n=1 Tax=Rhodosorus marinus TaxID=101924 RepID=A0A7S3ABV5_9RHOD|mmetsp:Transcript_9363/g.40677  ORF Transcript_9363/g.40677 Transcript_9363/m.40677 type:complete len:372 (+) Transcript_9363:64-1179(+)